VEDLVQYVASGLVKHPEQLSVARVTLDGKTVVHVQVAPDDLPRVIGEQGTVFRALRNIVTLVGSQDHDIVVEMAS